MGVHVAVGWVRGGDAAPGTLGFVQVTPRHGASERRVGAAVVEVAAAEVVVGVPGVGGELEEDRVGRSRGRADDEERVALPRLAVDIDGQQHLVVAGGPVVADQDGRRGRPAATVGGGITGCRMVCRVDRARPHHGALGPDPGDLHRHRAGSRRRQVEGDLAAGRDRLGPAVAGDRFERHGRILAWPRGVDQPARLRR